LTVYVAPLFIAYSRRNALGSETMMGYAPDAFMSCTNSRPIGPAPITVTLSPGLTRSLLMPFTVQARGSANAAISAGRSSAILNATFSVTRM
jgi:hypothetical protein